MAATSALDLKIIVIGDVGAGKSSLIQKFQKNIFQETYSATVGADFAPKKIVLPEHGAVNLLVSVRLLFAIAYS